jgi:hypothetical protein
MKMKRLALVTILIAAPAITTAYLLLAPAPPKPSLNVSKLVEAVAAFAREQRAKGRPQPETVSLRQLLAKGYLQTNEVRAFDGVELTLGLTADETNPNSILAQAKMPDGAVLQLLGDGSAQQLSPEAFHDPTFLLDKDALHPPPSVSPTAAGGKP